jgi:hypothetical protein
MERCFSLQRRIHSKVRNPLALEAVRQLEVMVLALATGGRHLKKASATTRCSAAKLTELERGASEAVALAATSPRNALELVRIRIAWRLGIEASCRTRLHNIGVFYL